MEHSLSSSFKLLEFRGIVVRRLIQIPHILNSWEPTKSLWSKVSQKSHIWYIWWINNWWGVQIMSKQASYLEKRFCFLFNQKKLQMFISVEIDCTKQFTSLIFKIRDKPINTFLKKNFLRLCAQNLPYLKLTQSEWNTNRQSIL